MFENEIKAKLEEAAKRPCWISVLIKGRTGYVSGVVLKTKEGYLISGYDEDVVVDVSQIEKAYIYGESA